MWLNGLILVTVLTAAKSAEAELNVEAAFQGHCGHTSPCEQLCYEIHDGMYECDCIEGYELNKNGYSCQVINSTLPPEGPTKSEEDVLYQKGASFSAKLANGVNGSNQVLISGENDNETEDDDDFITDIDDNSSNRKSNSYIDSNNSKDYYISSDSISFNDDQLDLNPVPEFKHNTNSISKNYSNRLDLFPDSVSRELNERMEWLRQQQQPDQQQHQELQALNDTSKSTLASEIALATPDSSSSVANGNTLDDDYYSRQDMSVYDDVNNNKLNLRPIDANTYQNEYNQLPATSSTSTTTTATTTATKEPNSLSNENISERRDTIKMTGNTSQTSAHKGHAEGLFNLSTEMKFNSSNYNNNNSSSSSSRAGGGGGGLESCSLDCGLDGVCETNDEGIPRCLCSFGKSGNGCLDDTKVRIPRFSKKSWLAFPALRGAYKHVQIRVEFRPESVDGIILLTGERDDLTGDFMALLIHQGFIEFWFDCGSGVGSVRSEEKVRLNEWNSVTIYRHRWDAWLLLNHGSRVQGRSKGLFSRITFREPVFLGGTGNITGLAKRLPVYEGMVGCIRRFVANEHEYSFNEHPLGDVSKGFDIQDCAMDKCYKYPCQHEGKCLPSDQGAICLCPMGFVGDLCELRLDLEVPSFNGSSYLRYAPLGDSALIWLELQVIIKPEEENGIILYTGHDHHGDFIALSLDMGFVEFSFDLGSGPAIVRSDYPITTGQWHTIKVSRTARLAVLKVDQLPEVMTISSNGFWHLSLPHNLYLGGVPHSDFLPTAVRHRGFFTGCIQKVKINSRSMSIVGEALGGTNVDNCPHACNTQPCGPLAECVPLLETYECRCGKFSPECNKTISIPMHQPSDTTSHISPTGNNQQHRQHNKLHSKHTKSHYPQRQTAQFSSSNSLGNPSHKSKSKRNRKSPKLAATSKPISDITPEMFYSETESRNAPTIDLYVDDTPINHDLRMPFSKHTETPHKKDFQFDESNSQLDSSVKQFSPEEQNEQRKEYSHNHLPVSAGGAAGLKSHKRAGRKHQRIPYKSDYGNVNEKGHYGDNDEQSTEIFEADSDGLEYVPATGRTKKRLHKRPAHRWKYHKKHNKYHAERRPLHEPMSTKSQPEDGLVVVDDVEDYHTKELFQDMKRIMKNRDNGLSTISTDTLESRTGANYESVPDQEPVIKKSLGACFTGTDSYFHYNDAETMSQIISYKIDLNLRIKTHSKNGVILWSGRQSALDTDDYLSLGIENGYLHFRYNLGSGEANVQFNATKLSDGLWHRVRAIRNSQEGFLEVDGRKSVMQRSPGKLRQLNTDTGLYVGGMTDVAYFTRRRYTTGMVGCISEIILAGELKLNFDPATLGTAHNVETGIL